MKTLELENYLALTSNKPVFVQAGYNRFQIDTVTDQGDHVLIHVSEDAENPTEDIKK